MMSPYLFIKRDQIQGKFNETIGARGTIFKQMEEYDKNVSSVVKVAKYFYV